MSTASSAVVTALTGRAWVRDSNGQRTELQPGSEIEPGAAIVSDPGSILQIQAGEGSEPLTLGGGREIVYDGEMAGGTQDASDSAFLPPQGEELDHLLAVLRAGPQDGPGDAGESGDHGLAGLMHLLGEPAADASGPADHAWPGAAEHGGLGSDTFAWALSETAARDTADPLGAGSAGSHGAAPGGDVLDLRDLLKDTAVDDETIANYLSAEETGKGGVVISVRTEPEGEVVRQIPLDGLSFHDFGVTNGADFIDKLAQADKFKTH